MNKIAIAMVAAFAVAAQAQLWSDGWTLDGDGANTPSGGYWFGYDDKNENGDDGVGGCSTVNFPEGDETVDVVTPAWQALGGTITYTFNDNCTYKYRYAGFGFNWFDPKGKVKDESDPIPGATSAIFEYSLTHDAGVTCVFELGADDATKYNNFTTKITAGTNKTEVYPFSGFKQDAGWGTQIPGGWTAAFPESDGIKFKCQANGPETGVKSATLNIHKLSFGAGGNAPILKQSPVAGLNMVQMGRMLSLSVERIASVQVINMQGALVHTQTLTPSDRNLNLNSLPVGVYMVRVPALGYSNKVILK